MSSPEDVAAAAAAAAAAPGTSGSSATSRMQSAEEERAAAARKLAAAQAELAALKRNIEGREQRIAREQVLFFLLSSDTALLCMGRPGG
jgi:hypothetical protein